MISVLSRWARGPLAGAGPDNSPMRTAASRVRREGAEFVLSVPPELLAPARLEENDEVVISAADGALTVVPAEAPDEDLAAFANRFTARYRDDLRAL